MKCAICAACFAGIPGWQLQLAYSVSEFLLNCVFSILFSSSYS